MKKNGYEAPEIQTMEVLVEEGIAASGDRAPGRTGTIEYDDEDDNYRF